MRVPSAVAWVSATLCLFAALAPAPFGVVVVDAAAVKAGAPEHLSTGLNMCARTYHSKGAVGCRSLSSNDMAPLFPIATADELAQFVRGEAEAQDRDQKYVLVLPEALLAYDAIAAGLDRIGGVFAYPQFGIANASFASPTPQGANTIDGALNPFADARVAWNRDGNALLERDLPFPVVLLESEAAGRTFTDRARMNVKNGAGATYTTLLNYYFGPPVMTSLECLAFRNVYGQSSPKCDPIGGQSAYSVRGSGAQIVLATAAMDTTALSHMLTPGANSAVSGLVALLAAAQALKAIPDSDLGKRIVFAAFQAERFGFVGSRKFLADVQQFTRAPKSCAFPVTGSASPLGTDFCTEPMLSSTAFTALALDDIAYAIAVDQVGVLPASGNFTVHVNPHVNASTNGSTMLLDALTGVPAARGSVAAGTARALPPTPLTSFVNSAEFGKKDLVAAVLAGYDTVFSTGASFSSRHDVLATVDVAAVTKAAQVLAETLYQLAATTVSADALKTITVSKDSVAELLTCVTSNWRCDLMVNVSTPHVKSMIEYLDLVSSAWPSFTKVPSLYAGPLDANRQMRVKKRKSADESVYYTLYNESWSEDTNRVQLFPNAYEVFTRAYLASAMLDASAAKAAPACTKNQDCANGGKGLECVYPGVCAPQRAHFHFAISPGLARTKQLGLYTVVNASMPLWTEPQWDGDVGSYVFPDPGELIGWLALLIGVVVTAVGVVLARLFLASVHKMKLL